MVNHRGIEYGILTDAPFLGARICAMDCSHNCPGCFNQHMRQAPYFTEYAADIIQKVIDNELCNGIILGGLEWTEQPEELRDLVDHALLRGLRVMIYTHMTIEEFVYHFPCFIGLPILVKCGKYEKDSLGYYTEQYDVTLSSANQKIYDMRKVEE